MQSIRNDQYFLIIGSMKSATTSLFEYLAEHPQICPASVKEPEYFSNQQRHHDTRNRVAAYGDIWQFEPARHAWAMEASTGYAKYEEPGVVAAIAASGIRPKFAYILRDPFARIESHYNYMRRKPEWRGTITDTELVQTSNYYSFVSAYVREFGRDSLLILDYNQLAHEPLETVNLVCGFLGIAAMGTLANTEARNVTPRPKSEVERLIRRQVPKFLSKAPPGLKAVVRDGFAWFRGPKRQLRPEERRQIAAELHDDMIRLGAEFGVDVARWGFFRT